MSKPSDSEIMRALINQVMKATPAKSSERNVITFITKPMWEAFLRATGVFDDKTPTDWILGQECMRVFGSKTILINSTKLFSISRAI